MKPDPDLIDAMFARYGVPGPWETLNATGIANHIYATRDVVLRVATDHPEAVADARTESVAAPVARAAGILTPNRIAFDDSRELVDRPFSLWERVHGEPLGLVALDRRQLADAWRQVGRELSRLHQRVTVCPDPQGYLDDPGRDPGQLESLLRHLADAGHVDGIAVRQVKELIAELDSLVAERENVRFIHNDVHAMNLLCTPAGELLAIIDWGDAGWGDPALDFAAIPLDVMPFAREGYESAAPGILGARPEAWSLWGKLHNALEKACRDTGLALRVGSLRGFLRRLRD